MGGGKKAGNKSKIKNLKTVEEKETGKEIGKEASDKGVREEKSAAGKTAGREKTGRKTKPRNPNLKLIKNDDAPVKQASLKEDSPIKTSSKEVSPKGTSFGKTPAKKSSSEKTSLKEVSPKETPVWNDSLKKNDSSKRKAPSKKKTSLKKKSAKKNTAEESVSKTAASKEKTAEKSASKTAALKEKAAEESVSKKEAQKEKTAEASASKKEASRESASKKPASKTASSKNSSSKGSSSKTASSKSSSPKKSAQKKPSLKKTAQKKTSEKKASEKKLSIKEFSPKRVSSKKRSSGKEVSVEYDEKSFVTGGWGIGEWFIQHKSLVIIWLTVFAVIGALAFACYYVITNYRVTTVYVDGNVHYSNEEIMDMVMTGVYGNNSLYLALKYKDKGVEGVPFVERMDVDILTPDTIRISVYEKALAGYVEYLGRYMYFDRDGIIVESSKEKTEGIPQVTGLKFNYVVLNEALPVENEGIFRRILSITQLLDKYELTADKIYFDSDYDLTLYFEGVRVTLGSSEEIDEKIMRLQYILPELAGKKGTLSMENYTEDMRLIPFHQD